jgi:predicted DNA-binding transcriptional regulator AlpA
MMLRLTELPDERLLSRDDVERHFGLSRRFLELAALSGDGPAMRRIGKRSIRYMAGDVRAWLETRKVSSTSHAVCDA